MRGLFAVDNHTHELILKDAQTNNIKSAFVLSTCNRTEIYAYSPDIRHLTEILTNHTKGSNEQFLSFADLKTGDDALQHLFQVAAGIDSQILGDYEILGQLKRAIAFSREHGMFGPIMDRMLGFVFQASKKIKQETALSSGTVSVSYATIELLKEQPAVAEKNILLVGAGKIGTSVCKNLKNYLNIHSLSITNRTDEKAHDIADTLDLKHIPYNELPQAADQADIIIVCTNAQEPTILPGFFTANSSKLIFDLSIPVNVHPDVFSIPNFKVIDVDDISKNILDKTLTMREAEVPKALEIIRVFRSKFWEWLLSYGDSVHLGIWKNKLDELGELLPNICEAGREYLSLEVHAQKTVSRLAVNLRNSKEKGCTVIHAINDYLEVSVSSYTSNHSTSHKNTD